MTDTIAQLSDKYGISADVLRKRLSRGWKLERAISEPVAVHKEENTVAIEVKTVLLCDCDRQHSSCPHHRAVVASGRTEYHRGSDCPLEVALQLEEALGPYAMPPNPHRKPPGRGQDPPHPEPKPQPELHFQKL